jgi:hypothetical protein
MHGSEYVPCGWSGAMSRTVTVEVPDALMLSAEAVAARTGRRAEEVLADWLGRSIAEVPIESLPDDEVLALRDLELPADQQAELDDLLDAQREGAIDPPGRARLAELLGIYRRGMLYKSRALSVAVARGIGDLPW